MFETLVAAEKEAHAKLGIYTNSTANYFQQLIDHANPSRGVFNQRYFLDFSYWNPSSGPVFLYIGGEGPLTQSPGGYLAVVAKEQQGLIVALEHRYYGVSLPAPLADQETLRTLNVDSALADLIHFISFVQETYLDSKPRRWVSVGGSYPGALSAWFRIKYPQIITASWSSSGVVNAVFSFDQFDRQLVNELSPACADAIRAVTAQVEAGWNNPTERARMLSLFNTPNYFTREDFLWMLADSAAMGPQYGFRTELCAAMLPLQKDPIAQFALNWTIPHYGADFGAQCYYSTTCLSSARYSAQWPNQLPWVYQCCTELAYWQVGYPGSLRSQLLTTEYFMAQCKSAFGPATFPNTTAFNTRFGGAAPALTKNATRVIALNGSDDPWQGAAVEQTYSALYPESTAACTGCGHCGDLHAPSNSTSTAVRIQQELISAYMDEWLQA